MYYHDFKGHQLSALGFGCMRLPVIDGRDADIDEAATEEMVAYAIEHGINYFDTAWGYHDGNSESAIGRILAKYPRESFYLATKFPGYDTSNFGKHAEIFEEQLQKCQVDHFDFYLLHNVCELNIEQYLDDAQYGTVSYFKQQRDAGKIGHLGFSVHGSLDTFKRFVDVYGDDMEFCQIQLNYMDWDFQNARAKVAYLRERGIDIFVMEPLRGGILVNLEERDCAVLNALRPGKNAVDWAFRWVADVPGVAMVLSGMSNFDQLRENIEIFETHEPLQPIQRHTLEEVGQRIAASKGVPCTSCRYCLSHCPLELDIPWLLSLYNEHLSRPSFGFIAPMALGALPPEKWPSACIGCGSCVEVCTQQIQIPDALKHFAEIVGK